MSNYAYTMENISKQWNSKGSGRKRVRQFSVIHSLGESGLNHDNWQRAQRVSGRNTNQVRRLKHYITSLWTLFMCSPKFSGTEPGTQLKSTACFEPQKYLQTFLPVLTTWAYVIIQPWQIALNNLWRWGRVVWHVFWLVRPVAHLGNGDKWLWCVGGMIICMQTWNNQKMPASMPVFHQKYLVVFPGTVPVYLRYKALDI